MTDTLINCSRCGGEGATYKQESSTNSVEFCMQCGFQFSSLMTKDSQFLKEQMAILPEIYKTLISEDEEGKIWIPSFTNTPGKGMVYANGTSRDDWWWEAVLYDKISNQKSKAIKKKVGTVVKEKPDMSTLKRFPEMDFIDALEYIGIL